MMKTNNRCKHILCWQAFVMLLAALCVAAPVVTAYAEENNEELYVPFELKPEAGMYQVLKKPVALSKKKYNKKATKRTLKGYYEKRAYPGAPPVISHSAKEMIGNFERTCLKCHTKGRYYRKFKAYAPITPHPEMLNCRQCHVAGDKKVEPVFKEIDWVGARAPELDDRAQPEAPPVIPHSLQMRGNCFGCHTGFSAVEEIRNDHPERVNCRQCHVNRTQSDTWARPARN